MRWFTLVTFLVYILPANAWGPEGHRLVARIAGAQLTPAAKARIAEILGPDRTLDSVASWADEARRSRPETANWHFVDIPIGEAHLDRNRDCAKNDCIVAKIEGLENAVGDPAIDADQRREALMFLVHFIGDMHEPLHCSDNEDRGGNGLQVLFFERLTNLHSVWDSGLLGRMAAEDELFAELSRESAHRAKKWCKGTVTQWAEQAHKSAQKIVYGLLPKAPEGTPIPLGPEYEKRADPLVKKQLAKAGARLAAVLNASLR